MPPGLRSAAVVPPFRTVQWYLVYKNEQIVFAAIMSITCTPPSQ
jgi:hypothetical protein